MYVGHAAIAIALKVREPRLPIVPLALACYGPDWLEVALMVPHKREGMAVFTHSIPSVLLGAAIATLLWRLTRRPGAALLGLGWLLHWPADLFTGRKPLILPTPLIGLDLYKIPFADFLLESVVVAIGCAIYARAFPARAELRRVIVILGVALVALQGAVDVALSVMRNTDWEPSLASAECRSHLPASPAITAARGSACILHFALALSTRGSDGDGWTSGHRDAGLPHLR